MLRHLGQCTALIGTVALTLGTADPATAAGDDVIVPRGSPVQIAVVLDHSELLAANGASARNAIQMALERHGLVRGFPVELNDFDGPCRDPAANAIVAAEVVSNPQNLAVIGHMCSPDEHVALPIYEQAGVVTVSGSATGPLNPSFGPDVFNSVAVPDDVPGEGDAWYATVQALPSDIFWRTAYAREFGSEPTAFADLYFDAASALLDQIAAAATLDNNGNLVINRGALAASVRSLTRSTALGVKGVTCWVVLDNRGYRVNDPTSLQQCGNTGKGH